MIAESIIFVLGIVFVVVVSKAPRVRWLPWVLAVFGCLFVLFTGSIFFVAAPSVVSSLACGAVLLSAVGPRWRWVGAVGGILGLITVPVAVGWWISSGGIIRTHVPLSVDPTHPAAVFAITADATPTFVMATLLAVEAIVIWVITRHQRRPSRVLPDDGPASGNVDQRPSG
jgi:hypothetical protein